MLPNIVNQEIGLCQSARIRAAWHRTLEHALLLLLMLCLHVKVQRRGMEKRLVAHLALKGEFPLVLLHMIVHRALNPLGDTAVRADILASVILLVVVAHFPHRLGGANFFNFSRAQSDRAAGVKND